MRCPKCGEPVPIRAMIFSDAFRGFDCAACTTALQVTYFSRLAVMAVSIVVGLGVATALRTAGLAQWLVVLGGGAALFGAYALACRPLVQLKVVK